MAELSPQRMGRPKGQVDPKGFTCFARKKTDTAQLCRSEMLESFMILERGHGSGPRAIPPRPSGFGTLRHCPFTALRGPLAVPNGRSPDFAALGAPAAAHLLLRPPCLPEMLRFRSAIFRSEEERNCFSLSSKAVSPEGAVFAA